MVSLEQYYDLVDLEAANIEERFADIFEKHGIPDPTFVSDRQAEDGLTPGSSFDSVSLDLEILRRDSEVEKFLYLKYAADYLKAARAADLPIFVEDYQ